MRGLYEDRLREFGEAQRREEGRGVLLGKVRATIFLAGVALYLGWDSATGLLARISGAGLLVAVSAFLGLVIWHRRVRARGRRFGALAEINRVALARMNRDWDALPPSPLSETGAEHPYAADLDVCGQASLFRLFTSVTLPPGFETLRSWLLEPAAPPEIRRRQEAVRELSPLLDFRQTLEAEGRLADPPVPDALEPFLAWAEGEPWLPRRPEVLWVARLLPLLNFLLFFLYWRGALVGPWWLLSLGASFGLGSLLRSRIHPVLEAASAGEEQFGRYAAAIGLLLGTDMKAPVLQELQRSVRASPVGAERELASLGRKVGWADIRYSLMAHAPLQAFLVWDVHMLSALEAWKLRSGSHVRGWLEALGRLEALSALAALGGDHPDWEYPSISEGEAVSVRARALGHPLLPQDQCVRNDLSVGPPGTFLFVTGSNMSGKSTLLRALGANVVLAQAGGPVCAQSMEMTPLRVQTSMRTRDSLAEGVSQYMAELNRIRQVVRAARETEGSPVLFLLDEPLQGTNEAERRVAVRTILGHLLDAGAIGAVATHDLLLHETDRLRSVADAVHLEGTVRDVDAGPLLSFDYILRPGRATSTNALALLRAVGLGPEREKEG